MNSLMKLTLAATLALSLSAFTLANAAQPAAQSVTETEAGATAPLLSEGEIKKIDREAGKVTIKHGPLANLNMPAMTMVFHVKDPAMLNQVKVGDKITFVAERAAGQFTVTQVEVKQVKQ